MLLGILTYRRHDESKAIVDRLLEPFPRQFW